MTSGAPPSPGLYGGGPVTPIPDPTHLTREAVAAATDVSRRELASSMATVEARLHAMDEAGTLKLDLIREIRPATERLIEHLRALHEVKFTAIDQRFEERDVRTEQAASAGKQALDAALQAAKELVGQQNKAATDAAAVMIANFTKLIDQLGLRLESLQKSYDDRLTELKERIDRGEGAQRGSADAGTATRLNIGAVLGVVSVLLVLIFGVLAITLH